MQVATAVGLIWAFVLVASGMVYNYGMWTVTTLYGTDRIAAVSAWQAIEPIAQGLGGASGELLGGLWVLLVSAVVLRYGALPKALGWLGLGSASSASLRLCRSERRRDRLRTPGDRVVRLVGVVLVRVPRVRFHPAHSVVCCAATGSGGVDAFAIADGPAPRRHGRTGGRVLQQLSSGRQRPGDSPLASQASTAVAQDPSLTVIESSVLELPDEDLARHVDGCDSVISCLGHTTNLAGSSANRATWSPKQQRECAVPSKRCARSTRSSSS